MTAPHIIDPAGLLGEALSQASPDLMRSLLQHVINALLSADADAVCGAQWGQQDPQRHAQRNGYRYRPPGHQGWHHRRGDPQATLRHLLPTVVAATPQTHNFSATPSSPPTYPTNTQTANVLIPCKRQPRIRPATNNAENSLL